MNVLIRAIVLYFVLASALLSSAEVILLFGPPGAGKGTFSQFATEHGLGHISAGDLIRDEIAKKTKLGLEMEEIVLRGEYVDPEVMFQLVKAKIHHFADQNIRFIVDGYGRSSEDAARLRGVLEEIDAQIQVVFLEANDEVCHERIIHRLICNHCHFVYNEKLGNTLGQLCPHCSKSFLERRIGDDHVVTAKRLVQYRSKIEASYRTFLHDLPTFFYITERPIDECFREYEKLLSGKALD